MALHVSFVNANLETGQTIDEIEMFDLKAMEFRQTATQKLAGEVSTLHSGPPSPGSLSGPHDHRNRMCPLWTPERERKVTAKMLILKSTHNEPGLGDFSIISGTSSSVYLLLLERKCHHSLGTDRWLTKRVPHHVWLISPFRRVKTVIGSSDKRRHIWGKWWIFDI